MAERTDLLRVALAQINPTVGDIRGNARKISDYIARARDEGAALVVFPELALTGYPPEDLLLKTSFLDAARTALGSSRPRRRTSWRWSATRNRPRTSTTPRPCSPTATLWPVYRKMYLPNYGVFDEQRYFQSGAEGAIVEVNGVRSASASARTSGSPARRR